MVELKIDPEFRDKIPPLSEAEFAQLRENILADGEVYEPIVTWKNVIVDGHNRWRIIQENPHIPFSTKEIEFANKWEAFAWMYKKQLGRRNLSDEQKTYLMGKRNEAEKLAHGGDRKSKSRMDLEPKGRTAQRIADECGVGYGTVVRAEKFAKAVDEIESSSPEAAKAILAGDSGATQEEIRSYPTMTPEAKSEFISDVVSGAIKEKHKGYTKEDRKNRAETEAIVAEMFDTSSIKEMTIDRLIDDITLNAEEYVRVLRNTLLDHSELLTPENKPIIASAIQTHIINEILKLKGIVER